MTSDDDDDVFYFFSNSTYGSLMEASCCTGWVSDIRSVGSLSSYSTRIGKQSW